MNRQQSERLKVGDRVIWQGETSAGELPDLGTVIDAGYHAVTITWDSGQTGMIDHRDMQDVSRYKGETK